mgnify:CR=1 FL=1|jgi:hypothetical protein
MKARYWMALITSTLAVASMTGCFGTQSSSAVRGPVAAAGVHANTNTTKHAETRNSLQLPSQDVILGQYQTLLEQYRDVTRRQEQ